MSERTTTRQFVGDNTYDLRLSPEMILELERLTNRGIGAIFRRLTAGEFGHAELVETVRLALVGGGMKPEQAAALTNAYIRPAPLAEVLPIALAVLEGLYFGAPAPETSA